MAILVISVNLGCCYSKAWIEKVLGCLKAAYSIEKIDYEDKNNKVIVRGKFDPEKLCRMIWCKACHVVKEIKIVEEWPPKPPPEPPKPECKLLLPIPYPLPYPVPRQCSPCQCRPPPPPPESCKCCKCKPPPPPCGCSKHEDSSCDKKPWCPPTWPPWCPPTWPPICRPPWG